jgi:hypothetical protein
MSIYVTDSSEANWILWVDQNGQRPGLDQLFAGRVKLQDDPIATAYGVFQEALEQLEAALRGFTTPPLF